MLSRCALILVLWLASCAPLPMQSPELTPTVKTEEPSSNATSEPTVSSPLQQKMTGLTILDLSKRLTIDPGTVHVISSESIIWPDAALGCPLPNEVYAQGTVPGFRVRLEADGQVYEYHTNTSGLIMECEQSDLPEFPVTPGEIDDGQPWMPVD